MTELLGIRFNAIAPIFLVVGAGAVIGRRFSAQRAAFSQKQKHIQQYGPIVLS